MEEIMTRDIITVSPDMPLEQAARIMVDNKIGGLPVMEDDVLVGIITGNPTIFKTLLGKTALEATRGCTGRPR